MNIHGMCYDVGLRYQGDLLHRGISLLYWEVLVWEVSCTRWFFVTGGVIWYTGRFLLCRLAYMGRLLKWEGWSPGGCFIESLLFGGGEGFSYQGV